jgi:hypothetical protein
LYDTVHVRQVRSGQHLSTNSSFPEQCEVVLQAARLGYTSAWAHATWERSLIMDSVSGVQGQFRETIAHGSKAIQALVICDVQLALDCLREPMPIRVI